MTNIKNAAKFIIGVATLIMAIDFIGFIAWAMSGQLPVDGFFIGTITTHILRAILF